MIKPENLYQPDKYKVLLGEGTGVGFCTLWNEPEKAIVACPDILKKSAIVGTLYSRQGVNIMLRNLALNPQIRHVYLWNNGALSCSPFGVSGKDILLKIWSEGVNENNEVVSVDFKLEKEIDPNIVELIRKNVSLSEITDSDLPVVASKLIDQGEPPYMEPVRFADAVPVAVDIFPSEKVGFLVRGKTVLEAWTKVVDRIMRYGTIKGTQYGTQQRELIGVTWVIENEDPDHPFMEAEMPESLKQTIGLNDASINHYRSVFLSPDSPEGVKYTYGNRLMRYPGSSGPIDQIEEVIIKELKDSIDTRRGVAITVVPEVDKSSKEPPCITQIQVLQTNKRLHLLVTVRSHDIFKAAIPNAFGLRALQQSIANKAGVEMGSLQITSQSAHIYEAEWDDAKKLVQCSIWEREPAMAFDPALHADPRGLFLISAKDGKITAYFKTPSGDDLFNISAKTAKEVAMKIAQLDIVSRPDHLIDIGMELEKAEIALTQKIQYTQDKPLPFERNEAHANVCLDDC
jgi:thymidylate synthase